MKSFMKFKFVFTWIVGVLTLTAIGTMAGVMIEQSILDGLSLFFLFVSFGTAFMQYQQSLYYKLRATE